MIHRGSILLAEDGARRLEAYRAAPEAPGRAGLVILHDMFGMTRPFHDLADDFAAAGHPVLVPNLFWRADFDGLLSYETGHQAAWARLERFDFGAAVADVRLALAALRRPPGGQKAAVLGFC
ncbi:MAG: dienelactone hydrolase family protein, partial [Stellaceae bacterium]